MDSIDANGNGKRGPYIVGNVFSRHRQFSDSEPDCPDLDYVYEDTDSHVNEIAELYSYTEQPEFQLNVKAFEEQMEIYKLPPSWQGLTDDQRKSVIMKLLDQLDVADNTIRMKAARCVLYLAQGMKILYLIVMCYKSQGIFTLFVVFRMLGRSTIRSRAAKVD